MTLRGHTSTVWCIDFDPSGSYLVSCSEDRSWAVWSVSETDYKKLCHVRDSHFRAIYSVSWSKSGRIATAGSDNQLLVFEVNPTELQKAANEPAQDEAAGCEPFVKPRLVAKVSMAHESDINCVQFSPSDPDKLATVSDDGSLKVWEVRSGDTGDVLMDSN